MTILADALAAEGYVVLAPDAYRGNVTAAFPRALWLRLTTPEEQVFNDVDASLAHLMSLENVDAERLASMGFCFGGNQGMRARHKNGGRNTFVGHIAGGLAHVSVTVNIIMAGMSGSDLADAAATGKLLKKDLRKPYWENRDRAI